MLLILWITVLVTVPAEERKSAGVDVVYLLIIWLGISIAEVVNPGASVAGWFFELRSAALYPCLIVPLGLIILRTHRHLDMFLILIIACSTLASLNGLKQLYIHPSPGEQRFLDGGGYITHILWGRLRVFSFYSDAGQFGASQAALGLSTLVLALGPYKKKTKLILLVCALLQLDGMLISGTRGALFALVMGAFVAIILTKNVKVLFIGGILLVGFICFLKYTYIGNGNYQIYRLRTAVNPQDASLNVRFNTQMRMREYMSTRPFGGGLGTIGAAGTQYNAGTYLSTVQPDSYFVKIWAMYGVVGLTIWVSIMVYILGKCFGIVWRIEDEGLKVKMVALAAGCAGTLFCSYGNEVINTMPSSIAVYLSWAVILGTPVIAASSKTNMLIK
ncbi:O-antigen ligase family protein [Mucilaginibacter corticis]|uniref:O-antigen ligase family protein n=1 Tax=Mucilaginibacter corticis TaxID=2597670 RepID=UPI001642D8FB|nr:O-antigen ligase family protein [Mucilaginibacter corticis]